MMRDVSAGAEHIIAIGDVHGCAEQLHQLLEILPIRRHTQLVFIGDYIDRGPDSKEVVDTVLDLSTKHRVVTLRGNHEEMLLDFLSDPSSGPASLFVYNGGTTTLASYGDSRGMYHIPGEHVRFFRETTLAHSVDDYFFVHAGVPDVPLDAIDVAQHKFQMLWIRERFFKSRHRWGKLIVHGHTRVPEVIVTPRRINIDTGCVFGGDLTAIELPSRQLYQVPGPLRIQPKVLRDKHSRRRTVRFKGHVPVAITYQGRQLELQTRDYSETGLRVRDTENPDPIFNRGDHLEGRLRASASEEVTFSGVVVWLSKQEDGSVEYGLEITKFRSETVMSPNFDPTE